MKFLCYSNFVQILVQVLNSFHTSLVQVAGPIRLVWKLVLEVMGFDSGGHFLIFPQKVFLTWPQA